MEDFHVLLLTILKFTKVKQNAEREKIMLSQFETSMNSLQ